MYFDILESCAAHSIASDSKNKKNKEKKGKKTAMACATMVDAIRQAKADARIKETTMVVEEAIATIVGEVVAVLDRA